MYGVYFVNAVALISNYIHKLCASNVSAREGNKKPGKKKLADHLCPIRTWHGDREAIEHYAQNPLSLEIKGKAEYYLTHIHLLHCANEIQ